MDVFVLILEIVILVGGAAIFSGLNISLMSLSIKDLERKAKLGNRQAVRVLPIRRNYHLSLASILFANVAVVSASSLVLEHHTGGLIAGIISTLLMVVFGEVLPQALFVKSALKFCSYFAPFVQVVTLITYPVSKPIQLLLDRIIGHENHPLHTRAELGMLISEHKIAEESELDEDEVGIIQGALKLSEKRVGDIMEPIEEVFWLTNDATLDAATVDLIKERAYSRVPVFDKDLTRCYGVLLMKDMVDIDFDETPQSLMTFHLHETEKVGSRTALDTMLRKFFTLPSHLVPVERDDRIVGILTVEDLVEEIVGHEIMDETDRAMARD